MGGKDVCRRPGVVQASLLLHLPGDALLVRLSRRPGLLLSRRSSSVGGGAFPYLEAALAGRIWIGSLTR